MQDLKTRVEDVMQAMKGKGQVVVNDMVEEVDDKVALTAFMGGLQTSKFLFFLSKEAPTSITELMVRAQKHINAEDAMNARKNKDSEDKRSDKKRLAPSTREERESKYKKFSNTQADRSSRRLVSLGKYNNYTPLNTSVEQVFLQIQDDASLKWPPKLKLIQQRGLEINTNENLVRKGHLRKFTTENGKGGSNPTREGRDDRLPQHQPMGEIKVILGGFAGGGETSSTRRAYARRIWNFSEVNEVGVTSPPMKLPRVEEPVITFSEEDDKGIHQLHDDPLVVSMVVANFTVRRILIDNGDKVYPQGAVTLPDTARANAKQVTVMVDFLVVDCPSSYNIILGRTALNAMKAITSTYHLLMRFLI
ncbi:uncharacterized protein LOC132314452 [Cornus florida]|uniref:uncharacterized protein LOC132314452 n=1 Tax=Cornus florida TaxID=4283 RepID=UPI0028984E96|nr:uncharacterized protein LOC132314452 [Cornus florida]